MHCLMLLYSLRWLCALSVSVRGRISELMLNKGDRIACPRSPSPAGLKDRFHGGEFLLPQLVAIDGCARSARHIVEGATLDKRVYARVTEQDQRRTIIKAARVSGDLPSLRE